MNRLLDQRDICGAHTIDGVRDYWIRFLHDARGGLVPILDPRTVQAYISDGRWVASCPECNGGIPCWRENKQGCCVDCGHLYTVTWHRDSDEVERLLLMRLNPMNRHWHPHLGETVDHIRKEQDPARMMHDQASRALAEGRTAGLTARETAAEIGLPIIDVSQLGSGRPTPELPSGDA